MCKGFMRISREKVSEFEWLSNPNTFYVFMRLLFKASYKDGRWEGVDIKKGQLITGRKALSVELNLSEQQIRTCLDKLQKTGYITIKSTNKYSIITICDYGSWKCEDELINQQNNQQSTSNQPAINQQITTIEEIKELKEEINKLRKEKEELTNVSKKKEKSSDLESEFDDFRKKYKKYGGRVRGLDTELGNLKKKHADWREIIPLLSPALEKENAERHTAELQGMFFPQMKNLQTYINSRSWESYADDEPSSPVGEYNPVSDGIFKYWNPERKCLMFNGDIDRLEDGYGKDNRPDGAKAAWGMYEWVWNGLKKEWVKQ